MLVFTGFYPLVWGTFNHTRQSSRAVVFVSLSLYFESILSWWLITLQQRGALVSWMVDVRLKPRGVGTASDRGGRQNGGRDGRKKRRRRVQDGRKGSRSGADMGWLWIVSFSIRLSLQSSPLSICLCHCLAFPLIPLCSFSVSLILIPFYLHSFFSPVCVSVSLFRSFCFCLIFCLPANRLALSPFHHLHQSPSPSSLSSYLII